VPLAKSFEWEHERTHELRRRVHARNDRECTGGSGMPELLEWHGQAQKSPWHRHKSNFW